jgi:ATP-dependent helicase/nuclease subunit B
MQRLVVAPFGPPALDALAGLVAAAQGDDPLAPVTVVVPSAPAAVSVRRALGRRSGRGLANVRVLALPQLAELLATGPEATDGRPPLTATRATAAVRAGLADARDPLSRVPASAAVEEALAASFTRLREATDPELEALAARSLRAAAVVDRYHDHRRRLAGHLHPHDLLGLAAAAVRASVPATDEVGPVVLHLPRRLGRADLDLLGALAGHDRLDAVLGATGDADADRTLDRLLAQLEPLLGPAEVLPASAARPVPTVIEAPDPDEEARQAVRVVLAHLEEGAVDLDRIAIVSRVESPYRLLLHEHLAAAGLVHHVDLPWSVAQSAAGRVLVGLLDLPEHGYRRADVARWMRSGPIRWRGRPLPVGWDAIARRAGVVQGLDQWASRLDHRRAELEERVERGWVEADEQAPRIRAVDDLQVFMAELGARVDGAERRPWRAWADWALAALDDLLDPSTWPDDERADLERVRERLAALGELDEVEPPPDPGRFRRVLVDELGRARRRIGRLGQGIQVGDVASVHGLDLDLLVVVGLAEGWYPPRTRDDPLLPDREVHEAGLDAVLGREDRADERRDHLAAWAAAAEVVLSVPRGDPRGQRELHPARWLLEAQAALPPDRVQRSPSFEDTTRSVTSAIDAGERDLAALLSLGAAGTAAVAAHPVARADAHLARGLEAVAARRDRAYGEWNGRIGIHPELRFDDEATASATRLERFAWCPFRYLLSNVLGVRAHDDPVDAQGITARDRGSLVHQVLEEFFGEALDRPPDEPWDDDDRRRLHELVDRIGDEYREAGLTGRDLGWGLEAAGIRRWLGTVLDTDTEERSGRGTTPVAVELAFGGESEPPAAEVALPDGRRLRFRGAIDRVDRAADGSLLVVDYKTGKSDAYRDVDKDRLDRGRRLQLPIYADAARRALDPDAQVDAYYWFVEESGRKAWRGGRIDEPVQRRFEEVVSVAVDAIEAGDFPANPGQEDLFRGRPTHCSFCDYHQVCPTGRVDLWEGIRDDPAIERYVELAEGEVP